MGVTKKFVLRKVEKIMKRVVTLTVSILLVAMTFATAVMPITSHAESYEEYAAEWLRKQQEKDEKLMDELEAEGTLTQEAIDSISKGTSKRKPNCKSKTQSNDSYSTGSSGANSYSGAGKGWVYSTDELHVVGLPEGENGYTKPGWYGDIN